MSKHNGKQELHPCPDDKATFTMTAVKQAGKVIEWMRNYPVGGKRFS